MRLQRFLSQAGVAARRKAEELITAGRVRVNGVVVDQLGSKVDPDTDRVQVDGQPVEREELFYVLLNKPKGCLTTMYDPAGRPTVMDYLPRLPVKVVPVGRLDFNTEGVLLLTNDGELSAALQAARTHAEKIYHVKLRGTISEGAIDKLRRGVRLDDGHRTMPAQVDRVGGSRSQHDWLVITLVEGKSRQIHRMLDAVGLAVAKIQRVAFAGLTFHGLRVGDARELTHAEVTRLREVAGLGPDARAIARGHWSSRREQTDEPRRVRDSVHAERGIGVRPRRPPPPPRRAPAKRRPRR
ncbi:MAG TPA: pseudouridine synthase [Kofleriaceae bacterium]|nr:pseudouridine synthase [Kofleriaceae bacterium]